MDGRLIGPTSRNRERRALWEAMFWTGGALASEVLVGWWYAGSVSLLSDAAHLAHHLEAIVVGLFAFSISARARSHVMQERIEAKATTVIGFLLVIGSVPILWQAGHQLFHPGSVRGEWMFLIAVIGTFANARVLWVLRRFSNRVLKGVALHTVWDMASSVVVVFCSVLVVGADAVRADGFGGLVIGVGVIVSGLLLAFSSHTHAR